MNTVKFIAFQNAGYGHVKVSATVNDTQISFTTDDTRMTDAASDEDDEKYEEAMKRVIAKLEAAYEKIFAD